MRKLCSVTALHSRFVDTLSYAEGSSEELSAVNVINMTSCSCPLVWQRIIVDLKQINEFF